MVCTYCSSETHVINSRHQKRANNVWRRRKCLNCNRIVTTVEQIDYEKTWTVAYLNESEQPFLRDKLLISLYQSCRHRPTALPDALGLTDTVISRLRLAVTDGSVTPTAIATICSETLRRFDKTAATVYKAYHADVL